MKIIIEVYGGLVEHVYADQPVKVIEVLDHDNSYDSKRLAEKNERLKKEIKKLQEVY